MEGEVFWVGEGIPMDLEKRIWIHLDETGEMWCPVWSRYHFANRQEAPPSCTSVYALHAKRRLTKTYKRRLDRLVHTGPRSAGFRIASWTSFLIRQLRQREFSLPDNRHYVCELRCKLVFSVHKAGSYRIIWTKRLDNVGGRKPGRSNPCGTRRSGGRRTINIPRSARIRSAQSMKSRFSLPAK